MRVQCSSWVKVLLAIAVLGCSSSSSNPKGDGPAGGAGGTPVDAPAGAGGSAGGGGTGGSSTRDGAASDGPGSVTQAIPGLSAIAPLKIARWTTFHRITNFQRGDDAKFIYGAKMSADGTRVVFSGAQGTFTIATDGSNLVRLTDKLGSALVDISSDGSKVAWYDGGNRDGFVASSDGSVRNKLAGILPVIAMRMTAQADRVFVLSPEAGGLFSVLATGGLEMTPITTTATVGTLNGVDANGNYWRNVLDISDDGARVAFTFLWDAFAMNGDGTGLRQLTQFLSPENRTLKLARVSASGSKLAWNTEDGPRTVVNISDWGGGNPIRYEGPRYTAGDWLQMPGDGSMAVLGGGIRLLETGKVAVHDVYDYGTAPAPLGRPAMVTMTANGKRACLIVEGIESTDQGRPNQIVIVDFNPTTLNGAPAIEEISAAPGTVTVDGSSTLKISALVKDPNLTAISALAMRSGWRISDGSVPDWGLNDEARDGDATAKDQTFTTNRVTLLTDWRVTAGPFDLRFTAANQAGHVLLADVEGVEAR
jgi:hypothetical protein